MVPGFVRVAVAPSHVVRRGLARVDLADQVLVRDHEGPEVERLGRA